MIITIDTDKVVEELSQAYGSEINEEPAFYYGISLAADYLARLFKTVDPTLDVDEFVKRVIG